MRPPVRTGALGLEPRGSLSLGGRPSLDGNLNGMAPSAAAALGQSGSVFVSGDEDAEEGAHLDLEEVSAG